MELMYADLGVLSLVIRHLKSGLTSKQIPVFGRDKKSPDASIEGGGLRETELDVDFGDGAHNGKMKVRQDDDGVLEASLWWRVFFSFNPFLARLHDSRYITLHKLIDTNLCHV